MILDTGICTVFRKADASAAGDMPSWSYTPVFVGWYKELSYETAPVWQTDGRKELRADGRIRILQCRDVRQNDVVVMEQLKSWTDKSAGATVYKIVRAYHGKDDDGPMLISDLTLEVVSP